MTEIQELTFDNYTSGATAYKLAVAASNNLTSLVARPALLLGIQTINIDAAPVYLKLYNKASAPVVASDVPVMVIGIPGNANGAGNNVPIPQGGILFPLGIAFAVVTGIGDTNNTNPTVSETIINIQYK